MIIKLISILLLFSTIILPQWILNPFEVKDLEFKSLSYSSGLFWAAGSKGYVFVSADSCKSWQQLKSGISAQLNSIFFINNKDGWIVGDSGSVSKTTNAGQTWFAKSTGYTEDFYMIQFVDSVNGFICGKNLLLKTTDAGNKWTTLLYGIDDYFHGMFWINNDIGFIGKDTLIGYYRTLILKTTNGGANWKASSLDEFKYSTILFEIKIKGKIGFAIGEDFLIWKTTDSGESWKLITQPISSNFYTIDFVGEDKIWAAGKSTIKYSRNGGDNWIEQKPQSQSPYFYTVNSLLILDSLIGFAAGSVFENAQTHGAVFSTKNGGNITTVFNENRMETNQFEISFFPNPFNSSATLALSMLANEEVNIAIYDILGRKIQSVFSGYLNAGVHKINFQNSRLSSGNYLLICRTNNFVKTNKFTIIK